MPQLLLAQTGGGVRRFVSDLDSYGPGLLLGAVIMLAALGLYSLVLRMGWLDNLIGFRDHDTREMLQLSMGRAQVLVWSAMVRNENGRLLWSFRILPESKGHRLARLADHIPHGGLWAPSRLPDMEECQDRARASILGGAGGYAQEFRVLDGESCHWLSEQVRIKDSGRNRWKLVGVVTDITARKEAEASRLLTDRQLQEVLTRVDCLLWHGVVKTDEAGRRHWSLSIPESYLYWKLFQVAPSQRNGVLWDDTCVPEMAAMHARSDEAFRMESSTYEQEFRFVRANSVFWLREQVAIQQEQPGTWRVMGVVTDITARRLAEMELAAEKEMLAVTLRAMEEGIVTVDTFGRVCFMNRAAEALVGADSGRVRGGEIGGLLRLVACRDLCPLPLELSSVLQNGEIVDFPADCGILTAEGKLVEMEGCCVPLHDSRSQVIGAVVVLRDVTERHQLENQLQRASKLESVGILAGGIAHDFNNILTAIMGNLGLAMLDTGLSVSMSSYLREAHQASERARDLTQQLLTFAKGGDPVCTAVFLPEVVQEVTLFALRGSKVRCDFVMPQDLWPAEADKGQVGQIVQNLVINALHAMPEGGLIRIQAANEELSPGNRLGLAPGRYVCLSVSDSGCGIAPEALNRIFEPYFTTKKHGSGLGLATVFSIVRKHRGAIDVSSSPGHGTEFFIRIPASSSRAGQLRAGANELPPLPAARVLVMDDEASIRALQERILAKAGLTVELAPDGADAVSRYQAAWRAGNPYDLLIMDLTVPGGMGGCEALQAIRGINPSVRAIVASGYSSDPIMANHQQYGFHGMVPKPFDSKALLKVVGEVLTRPTAKSRAPFAKV